MFKRKNNINEVNLDNAIRRVHAAMTKTELGSDEHQRLLTQLERLTELKPDPGPKRVSPDAVVTVAGNLLGILIIVGYEREHVMTSKALNWLMKSKQ